jgi:hypothetical protein
MSNINGFRVGGAVGFTDGVDASQTTAVTEVILDSISFRGGHFKENDVLRVQAAIGRSTTTAAVLNIRLLWNTTNSTTGAVILGLSTPGTGQEYNAITRHLVIVNNTTTIVSPVSSVFPTDFGDSAGLQTAVALSTITAVNWNLDGFIILASSNTNSSTTITKFYLNILV